jgi:hypothetical protein
MPVGSILEHVNRSSNDYTSSRHLSASDDRLPVLTCTGKSLVDLPSQSRRGPRLAPCAATRPAPPRARAAQSLPRERRTRQIPAGRRRIRPGLGSVRTQRFFVARSRAFKSCCAKSMVPLCSTLSRNMPLMRASESSAPSCPINRRERMLERRLQRMASSK